MNLLLEALYLPPIYYMAQICHNYEQIYLEQYSYYEKSSCRNRAYIATSHGELMLSVPLAKGKHNKQAMREVRISYNWNWQKLHWHSLQTAYKTTPYFEYYEPIFYPFYHKKYPFLLDYNLELLESILKLLQKNISIQKTDSYKAIYTQTDGICDRRMDTKRQPNVYNNEVVSGMLQPNIKPYRQVFADRTGSIAHLSIIDLLFNTGNYAYQYLPVNL